MKEGRSLSRIGIPMIGGIAAFAALAALLAGLPMAVVMCREVSRQSLMEQMHAGEYVLPQSIS